MTSGHDVYPSYCGWKKLTIPSAKLLNIYNVYLDLNSTCARYLSKWWQQQTYCVE